MIAQPGPSEPTRPRDPVAATPTSRPSSPPVARKRSRLPGALAMMTLGGVLMAAGIYGGRTYLPMNPPTPTKDAPATPTEKADPDQAQAPDPAELDKLKGTMEDLSQRVAALQTKVDAGPPAVDLTPIEGKVAEVAKGVGAMPGRVETLERRAGDFDKAIESIRSEVAANRGRSAIPPAPTLAVDPEPAKAAPRATPRSEGPAPKALAGAVDLYKQGRYAQARDAFATLRQAGPDDARVWYYSALATGFAANQWRGEPEQLVNKAIELEKTGKPNAYQIDATFADLSPPGAKAWLDGYRKRAAQ